MRTYKTALFGTGFVGRVHLEGIRRLGFVQVYAIGEPQIEKARQLGAIGVRDSVVVAGNVITSAGPSTAAEVAFELLGMLRTEADASIVREMMGF